MRKLIGISLTSIGIMGSADKATLNGDVLYGAETVNRQERVSYITELVKNEVILS